MVITSAPPATPWLSPLRVLVEPRATFQELSGAPDGLRAAFRPHLLVAIVMSVAVAIASRQDTSEVLREFGAGQATGPMIGLSVLLALANFLGTLATLLFGALMTHFLCRLAGARIPLPRGICMYVLAMAPMWIRNLLLSGLLLSPWLDSPDRLLAMRFGDPFLLASGLLVYVGVRHVHGLGRRKAAVVATLSTLAGLLLNALSWM